jgi:membrane fusion protein (multidrug efflux system)
MAKRRPILRYFIAFFLMLVLVVAILSTLGFFKFQQIQGFIAQAKSGAFEPPPTAVTTTITKQTEWEPVFTSIGSVAAVNGVQVTTDLAGIVRKIAFESGATVHQGDLLVELDTQQERAQLLQAQAQRDLALITLNRNRDLLSKHTVAQQDYDNAQAVYNQTQASVDQYKALIDRKTLRAPFSGILGIRQVNLGQYLNTGDAVVWVQSSDPIYVNFNLPQQDLSELSVGQTVQVTADAYGDLEFAGKINAINPLIDQNTRNAQIQATLSNPDSKLHPGMYVNVRVKRPEILKVIAIPASSVHYAPYGDSVFIVTELEDKQKGKKYKGVKEQFVKLGETRGDLVAIVSGLKTGEEVVTSGVFQLKGGQAVIVNNETTPGSQTNPTPANS